MTPLRRRIAQVLGTSVALTSCIAGREARMRKRMDGEVCVARGVAIPTEDIEQAVSVLGEIDTPGDAAYVVQLNGYRVPCDGEDNYHKEGDSYYVYAESGVTCGGKLYGHVFRVDPDGTLTEEVVKVIQIDRTRSCPIPGRVPETLLEPDELLFLNPETKPGDWLAEAAYFEAAAVAAFEHLAADLARWDAPEHLVVWAERSAEEEKRHADVCRGLAQSYGVRPPAVELRKPKARSLLEIACENAAEGLTREAFGALLAHHQVLFAQDAAVREAMAAIAEEETRHAEFSLALHQWTGTRLSSDERREVNWVREEALRELNAGGHRNYSPKVRDRLGLPTEAVSRRLCGEFFRDPFVLT